MKMCETIHSRTLPHKTHMFLSYFFWQTKKRCARLCGVRGGSAMHNGAFIYRSNDSKFMMNLLYCWGSPYRPSGVFRKAHTAATQTSLLLVMYETRRRKSGRKRVFLRAEPCSDEVGDGSFLFGFAISTCLRLRSSNLRSL